MSEDEFEKYFYKHFDEYQDFIFTPIFRWTDSNSVENMTEEEKKEMENIKKSILEVFGGKKLSPIICSLTYLLHKMVCWSYSLEELNQLKKEFEEKK